MIINRDYLSVGGHKWDFTGDTVCTECGIYPKITGGHGSCSGVHPDSEHGDPDTARESLADKAKRTYMNSM